MSFNSKLTLGLIISLFISILAIAISLPSWLKRGYVWPKSKKEKNNELKPKHTAIMLLIILGVKVFSNVTNHKYDEEFVFIIALSCPLYLIIIARVLDHFLRKK